MIIFLDECPTKNKVLIKSYSTWNQRNELLGHPVVCALTSSRLDSFSVFVTHIYTSCNDNKFFLGGGGGGSFHPSNTLNRTLIPKTVWREQTKLTTIPVIICPNTSGKHNINLVVHNWHFLLPSPYLNAGFTRLLGHKHLPNQHWKETEGKARKRFNKYDQNCRPDVRAAATSKAWRDSCRSSFLLHNEEEDKWRLYWQSEK